MPDDREGSHTAADIKHGNLGFLRSKTLPEILFEEPEIESQRKSWALEWVRHLEGKMV